jgi:hypothetical protein
MYWSDSLHALAEQYVAERAKKNAQEQQGKGFQAESVRMGVVSQFSS